jgi:hypothetical protein
MEMIARATARLRFDRHAAGRPLIEGGAEAFDTIAASFLGREHRGIGMADQILAVHAVLGIHGDTDAGRHRHLMLRWPQGNGLTQAVQDLACDLLGMAAMIDALEDHGELVAADARDGVHRPHRAADPARDLAQELIAHLMPERVVDELEAVDVDEQQCHAAHAALRTDQGLVQPVREQRAIGQVCERVMMRQVLEVIPGPTQFHFRVLGLLHLPRR